MKKRFVAMILAGTMVFGQNVYATELPSGTEDVETEQQEETQEDIQQQETETSDEVKQSDDAQNVESAASDETVEAADYTAEDTQEADSDTYWEDIQQYASDDDDTGVFDEELYKANQNLRKRTIYVGNPILVSSEQVYENISDYHVNVSDDSVCKVSIEPSEKEYAYRDIKLDPIKSGKISFNITDANGEEVYNCEVTVLDNLPADAAPIKDIEIRSWLFARTYYGSDGYISRDELGHIQYLSFDYGCNKDKISDLSGLEYATGLKYLNLSGTDVKDVSPILNLKNLDGLSISGDNFKDFSWISNFTKLTDLSILKTSIKDFSFISKLSNLERLYLYSNEGLTDLSIVESLSNLKILDVSYTNISDLKPLGKLANLQEINMYGCDKVENIEPLYNLSKLRRLQIYSWKISDEQKLGMIRSWIENNTYSKGDLIEIPLYFNFLAWGEKLHVDITDGDADSIEIQQNDSNCVKILAKDKGDIDISISLGNANIKTMITIQGENADQICGTDSDKSVSSYNNVNEISQTILTNNGDLWRLYPEVKKVHSNVKKYVSKWIYTIDEDSSELADYILDKNGVLWSENKKIQSNIKDVNGHYAITNDNTLIDLYNDKSDDVKNVKAWSEGVNTIIYKEDGSVWFRNEVGKGQNPKAWIKVENDVAQFNGYEYLTKSGEIVELYSSVNGEYTREVAAMGVADADWDNGFYYGKDGNCYIDWWNSSINIGKMKISKWAWDYNKDTYYILTDDSKLYYFTEGDAENKKFIADNVVDLDSYTYNMDKVYYVNKPWVKTKNGKYFNIVDGKLSETDDFNENTNRSYTRNGVTILTKVKDVWHIDEPKKVYALRTDGTVWDVTDVPKMILDLEQSTVEPGDVDGDSKVTTKDLMIVLYGVSGRNPLTSEQELAADIDGDGKVSVADLTRILYYVSGRNATL